MLELRKLSPALQLRAQAELNETDELIRDSVAVLREWLAKQPHINGCSDEQFFLNFLRACKYSLEKTKKKIDAYFTVRSQMPQYFRNRNIYSERTQELIRKGYMLVLPNTLGEDGPRVFLFRLGCFNANEYSPQDMMTVVTLILDLLLLLDDNLLVAGFKVLHDAAGLTMNHVLQYNPNFMKQFMYSFLDGSPCRMKGAYVINLNSTLETFVHFAKSFMNPKISSRVHIVSTKTLNEHIPQKFLPKEYGGDAGTIDQITNNWIEKLKENDALIKEGESFSVDESKRPSGPKHTNNMFGTEGSFRTLNFD